MSNQESKMKQWIDMLGSSSSRSAGICVSVSEGEYAANMIASQFKSDAVLPLAKTYFAWQRADPSNYILIRKMGFRDSESARIWRHNVTKNTIFSLKKIPQSSSILLSELLKGDSKKKVLAAITLGGIRDSDAVIPLIEALDTDDTVITDAASEALTMITGKSFLFGKKDSTKWRNWWNRNKSK